MKAFVYANRVFWFGGRVPACRFYYSSRAYEHGIVSTAMSGDCVDGGGWIELMDESNILDACPSSDGVEFITDRSRWRLTGTRPTEFTLTKM